MIFSATPTRRMSYISLFPSYSQHLCTFCMNRLKKHLCIYQIYVQTRHSSHVEQLDTCVCVCVCEMGEEVRIALWWYLHFDCSVENTSIKTYAGFERNDFGLKLCHVPTNTFPQQQLQLPRFGDKTPSCLPPLLGLSPSSLAPLMCMVCFKWRPVVEAVERESARSVQGLPHTWICIYKWISCDISIGFYSEHWH